MSSRWYSEHIEARRAERSKTQRRRKKGTRKGRGQKRKALSGRGAHLEHQHDVAYDANICQLCLETTKERGGLGGDAQPAFPLFGLLSRRSHGAAAVAASRGQRGATAAAHLITLLYCLLMVVSHPNAQVNERPRVTKTTKNDKRPKLAGDSPLRTNPHVLLALLCDFLIYHQKILIWVDSHQ